jgi:hypothetical protein
LGNLKSACTLAVMSLTKKKRASHYLKLFRVFEAELRNYHPIFGNDDYSLEYVICLDYFGDDNEIRIIFKMHTVEPMNLLDGEKYNLKGILRNYCSIFSIDNITVVKSFKFGCYGKPFDKGSYVIPKLEDRVFFEYFRLIDKFYEVVG